MPFTARMEVETIRRHDHNPLRRDRVITAFGGFRLRLHGKAPAELALTGTLPLAVRNRPHQRGEQPNGDDVKGKHEHGARRYGSQEDCAR